MTASARSTRAVWWAILCASVGVYGVFITRGCFVYHGKPVGTLFDDALISLRYATNLMHGRGLVWNPGEVPRVEGYTNLGWTLVMAAVGGLLPRTLAPIAVSITAGAILVAGAFLARRLVRAVGGSEEEALAAGAIILLYFPLVFWSLRGMEVGHLALLLLYGAWTLISGISSRGSPRSWTVGLALIASAAFVIRNDALVVFAPLLVVSVASRPRDRRMGHALLAGAIVGTAVLAQLAFRYSYYGELVPNTYVLKMTGVPTLVRVRAGLLALAVTSAPLLWILEILILTCVVGDHRTIRLFAAMGLSVLVAQMAYMVWIGGDAWLIDDANRFIATAAPFAMVSLVPALRGYVSFFQQRRWALVVFAAANASVFCAASSLGFVDLGPRSEWAIPLGWLLVVAIPALAGRRRGPPISLRVALVGLGLGVLVMTCGPAWARWMWSHGEGARFEGIQDDIAFARQGLMLGEALPPDASLAASWLGAPSFFSDRRAIDLLGKTDKHIARLPGRLPFRPGHDKEDLAYSVGQLHPDVVLIDAPSLRAFGYDRLPNGVWIRAGFKTQVESLDMLGHSWCTSTAESSYCPAL